MSSRLLHTSDKDFTKHRNAFLAKIKTSTGREPSFKIASETLNFMRKIVVSGTYGNVEELVELLKRERESLTIAEPNEFVISNVVLSVLKMIREESKRCLDGLDESNPYDSLNKLWNAPSNLDKEVAARSLKKSAVAAINEFASEMENCRENMCLQAVDHISSADIIITHSLGTSTTLKMFFEAARKANRTFRLFAVDEDCELAEHLASVDIFTAMQHATRVIISAVALLPDGSCVAPAGTLMICLCAKRYSVSVSVCAAFYKISPCFLPDLDHLQSLQSPSHIVPFSEFASLSSVQIVNPLFDLIPAQLISLYITHTSAISPSHVYRLIGDYYHPEDVNEMYG